MAFDVVGFGALNLDKLYQVNKIAGEDDESFIKDLNVSCGGSAANTLIGLSRLNLKTAFLGKVARDREGEILLQNLEDERVNTEGVIISPEGRSGSVMGYVDEEGERALYVDSGVNDEIKLEEIDLNLAFNTKILHLTSFVGDSIHAQEGLLDKLPPSVKVSLDPGRIYAEKGLEDLSEILERTDILLLNRTELKLLTRYIYKTMEEEIESLKNFDIDIIVVKLGERGCYATDGESSYFVETFPANCKDTTGAGDAFNAGFIFGYLKGENLEGSCVMGNYVAAQCVEDFGGTTNLPDALKLKGLLKDLNKKN
ncbi:MAG: carbohydrate kinase family protein [Methanobacterium sp.]